MFKNSAKNISKFIQLEKCVKNTSLYTGLIHRYFTIHLACIHNTPFSS
jgi:hypothetical protein